MGDERSVGWAAAPNARVALHYDEHALHIRFEVIMPEGAEPKVTSRNERDTSQNDDAVEVFLSPTGHNVDMVQFGGNAGGTFWDRPVGQGNFDWGWNPA